MKPAVVSCALCLAACSATPVADLALNTEPVEGCEVTDCFNQLQIRDFEVVDTTTLVLYIGGQRCPFRVTFQGVFCDLTFLPGTTIEFTVADATRARTAPQPTGRYANLQICAYDRNVGIAEDPFTQAGGAIGELPDRLPCEIREVESLTDDELMELYVENRFAPPPPPFGNGTIAVPEADDAEEEGADSAGGETAAPEDQVDGATQPTAAVQPR